MHRIFSLLIAAALTAAICPACKTEKAATGTLPAACDTVDRAAIAAAQGEQVLEAVPSGTKSGDLTITQCFYKLPTYSRSVNFEVTSGPSASIDDYWNKRFRNRVPSEEEEEREREREKKGSASSEEEREKEAEVSRGPQPVSGLGDEAFWVANQMNGSLFIRRGSAVYRIGIGGPEDAAGRLDKATAIAKSFLNKKQ